MTDAIPDHSAEPAPHVPWETIGAAEPQAVGEARAPQSVSDENQLPLTPWEGECCADAPDCAMPETNGEPQLTAAPDDSPPASPIVVPAPLRGGGWTLPVLCAGIALIACCVVIPQADANRRLAYEREMLQMEMKTVEQQIAVNGEFLKKVGDDPILAERLAERQMKVVPEGSRVLELDHEQDGSTMSPFQLVRVPAPPPLPPYKPVGGTLAKLCYNSHSRLYLIGVSLGMIATGLVLGYAPNE